MHRGDSFLPMFSRSDTFNVSGLFSMELGLLDSVATGAEPAANQVLPTNHPAPPPAPAVVTLAAPAAIDSASSPGQPSPGPGSAQQLSTPTAAGAAAYLGPIHCSDDELNRLEGEVVMHPHYVQLVDAMIGCLKVGEQVPRAVQLDARQAAAHAQLQEFRQRAAAAGVNMGQQQPEVQATLEQCVARAQQYQAHLAGLLQEADQACQEYERHLNCAIQPPPGGAGQGQQAQAAAPARGRAKRRAASRSSSGDGSASKRILNLAATINSRPKKGKLPEAAVEVLRAWWDAHRLWPYPDEATKEALARRAGLELSQVTNWYINQRKRHWLTLFPAGKAPHSAEEAQDMLEAGLLPGLLAGPGAGGSRPGAVKTSEESSWDSDSDMEG